MRITGRTPHECFDNYNEILKSFTLNILPSSIFFKVLPDTLAGDSYGKLGFHKGRNRGTMPFESKYGNLHLELNQDVKAIKRPDTNDYRLTTLEYRYCIYLDPNDKEPLIRWEFEKDPKKKHPDNNYPRNHLHIPLQRMNLKTGKTFNFLELHTPTGRVTIEEVIRFIITDLDYKPRSNNWREILEKSEQEFYGNFAFLILEPGYSLIKA